MSSLSSVSADLQPTSLIDQRINDAQVLPPELEAVAEKHYSDCNIRPYIARLAIEQEAYRNGKVMSTHQEIVKLRDNFKTITDFLDHVHTQLQNGGKSVSLEGMSTLTDKLYELLPDKRLKGLSLTRQDAEHLSIVLTRKSERDITPQINELTVRATHLLEDLDKILPLLKEIMKAYDDLINRINNKPH